MRKALFLMLGTILTFTLLAKDKFYDKPFSQWKKGDVFKILNDSPWARQQTYASQVGGKGSGVGGEKEIYSQYTIRFFSAQPIREAYVRMMQLMNNYDSLSADQKSAFDQRFAKALAADFGDEIIVAGEFGGNDPDKRRGIETELKQKTAEQFKQSVYLISDRLGQVQLKAYYPPSPDGTGFKFVFPRTVDGKPVIAPEDKEVTFKWYFWDELTISYKVKDMMYRGKLEF
jgi:hypothetical protein